MSTFLPSPTRVPSCHREKGQSTTSDAVRRSNRSDTKDDSLAKEMPMVVGTQNDVQQNAWRDEARRCSAGAANNGACGHQHSSRDGSKRSENAEHLIRKFEDWLMVVEKEQGQISTVHQTDLCVWFHEERLAAKTPFAAVVPCPASLRTEKARQNVVNAIDTFAFPTFYVQTLPMGAKLSEVSQAFVRTPAHLPEVTRYRSSEEKGKYVYTTVPCHNGADAMDLISRYVPLQDAVRDVPCLLLNDYCPLTPLCLRCLVVAGRCVAAEVACDEAYTPLFGIRPNNVEEGRNGFGENDFMGEERTTVGERSRASAAARRREAPASKLGGDEKGAFRTASDVIAFGLKRFVEETLGASLAGRSYTALIAAEVKGFDPRVLGPRESDPPFWPVMTNEPLHQKPSPFGEAGLRFYALSFDYANPTPFEAFAAQELHAVGDYVLAREAEGVLLPPILRFLDGHEAERAAAHPPPAWTASETSSRASADGEAAHRRHSRSKSSSSSSMHPSSAAAAAVVPYSLAEDTSSTVSSPLPSKRVAAPRAADASTKERPKKASTSHADREQTSPRLNQSASQVKAAPIVLKPHDNDSTAPGGKMDSADVDDASSTISSDSRTSSRLPSRTSSFNRPTRGMGSMHNNAALAERPTAMPVHADPSVKSATTASSRLQLAASSVQTSPGKAEKTASEASSHVRRDGRASVDRSETDSCASTHSSRLPERRLPTAASSVASGSHRSSVARADDLMTETESVRSSLPPRRRSSVLAVAVPRTAPTAAAPTTNALTAPAEEAPVASTPSEGAAPSHKSASHRFESSPSSKSSSLLQGSNCVPELPTPLRPEDIPMVASPTFNSSHSSDIASTAYSAVHSTRSSRPRVRGDEERASTDVAGSRNGRQPDSVSEVREDEEMFSAKSKSPSASVKSSVTGSAAMSSARTEGTADKDTHTVEPARETDTASVVEFSATTRTSTSAPASQRTGTSSLAVPPPRVPEALQYEEEDELAVEKHSAVSGSGEPEQDGGSVYSSSYASTHSAANGTRQRDNPATEEAIPYVESPPTSVASSEFKSAATASVRSSVVPSCVRAPHKRPGVAAAAVAADRESEASSVHPSQRSSRPATVASSSHRSMVNPAAAVKSSTTATSEVPSVEWTPRREAADEAVAAAQSQRVQESPASVTGGPLWADQDAEDLNSASSVSQPHSRFSRPPSSQRALQPSLKSPSKASEDAETDQRNDAAASVKLSVESSVKSPASTQRSAVPIAGKSSEEEGAVQPAEDAAVNATVGGSRQAATRVAVSHSSSSSSSSSSYSYSYTSSLRVVVTGNDASDAAQPIGARESDSAAAIGRASASEPRNEPSTAAVPAAPAEEIDTEMSQTSRGGSHQFRDEEDSFGAQEEEDVDVGASQYDSQEPSPACAAPAGDDHGKSGEEADGVDDANAELESSERSLVASAHSFFDTAPKSSSTHEASRVAEGEAAETSEVTAATAEAEEETPAAPAAENGDEMASTEQSSETGVQSELYRVNSADLHSCISASVISSQSTAMRRWASGPASEANYAGSQASWGSRFGAATPGTAAAVVVPAAAQKEAAAAAHSATPSLRSTASAKSWRRGGKDEAKPSASVASRRTTAASSKSGAATPPSLGGDEQPPVVDVTAATPTSIHSNEVEEAPGEAASRSTDASSETATATSLFEHSDRASSNGRRNASTTAATVAAAADAAAEVGATVDAETGVASPGAAPAASVGSGTSGAQTEDSDEALRKARLRAIAAVIVANAAYEEVERVAAMYKQQ